MRGRWLRRGALGRSGLMLLAMLMLGGLASATAWAADGDPDSTFGSGGTAAFQLGFGSYHPGSTASAVAEQPNGKLVAAGANENGGGDFDLVVARLTRSGALDPSFGAGGSIDVNLGDSSIRDTFATAIAIQPDGKIVVAGDTYDWKPFVLRLNPTGALDGSFGSGGVVRPDADRLYGVSVAPDGGILVAGDQLQGDSDEALFLERLTPAGSIDGSFGSGGTVVEQLGDTPPDSRASTTSVATGIAVGRDGKVIVCGYRTDYSAGTSGTSDNVLVRFTASGAPDGSFGRGGEVTNHAAPYTGVTGEGLALTPDGKVVEVENGTTGSSATTDDMVVQRFGSDGTLDPAFGNAGSTRLAGDNGTNLGAAVALRADGEILLTSPIGPAGKPTSAVVELSPAGAPNSAFGSGGTRAEPVSFAALLSQSDGKTVLAGSSDSPYPSGSPELTVMRLLGPAPAPGGPSGGGSPSKRRRGSRHLRVSRRALLARGLRFTITPPAMHWPGRLRASLVFEAGRSRHPRVIGAVTREVRRRGRIALDIRLTRAGRRLFARQHPRSLIVTLSLRDSDGKLWRVLDTVAVNG